MNLSDAGLLCCSVCSYVWKPLYGKTPKTCPRCTSPMVHINHALRLDIAGLVGEDLTLGQRQQLYRAITLWVSGDWQWAEILLDSLHGEPELDYHDP